MDTWEQRIEESPAFIQASAFKESISKVDVDKVHDSERPYYERAELVIDSIIDRLNNTDARLVNVNALAQLQTPLQNAVSYLNSWVQGSGENYITSLTNSALDESLNYVTNLGPTQDVPQAREAVTSLRRSVARHNQIVESEIAKVVQKGRDADATIDQKVLAARKEFESLEGNINDLSLDLKEIKSASAQVSTEQQTAFTKAEADRSTTFNKLVTDKQKELSDSIEKMASNAEETIAETKKNVQADEDTVGNAKKRIEEILGIVGEDALISDYAQTKTDEQKSANLWRWITIGSLLVAVVLATVFAFTVDASTPWQRIITKALIVLSLGGIGGYAGKQSGEHRIAQRQAETMALQLKALKPYLYDLEDTTKRDDLLVKIADRIFGQVQLENGHNKINNKVDESIPTPQLIDVILELLKKIDTK